MSTVLADARRGHAGLYWLAAGMAVLALVTAGPAVLDPRALGRGAAPRSGSSR